MLTPHKMREIVFHLLYSADFAPDPDEEVVVFLMKHHLVTKKSVCQAQAVAAAVQAQQPVIDAMIAKTATSYAFNRILGVEKNLLRLGVFELFFSKKVPPKVAISEAMRLARKFGSHESAHFINKILDVLYRGSCKTHFGGQIR